MIGSDESIKGDTFGGLVVVAVRVDDKHVENLKQLGVQDSKRMSDNRIKIIARKIKEVLPFHVLNYFPKEYNQKVSEMGLTSLLNEMHTECTQKLKAFGHQIVVDKFPGCNVEGAICEEKAEKHMAVALASIIARAEALEQFQELSLKAGMKLPMGSTHVIDALVELIKTKDLSLFAKTSFKNVKMIMENK